MEEIKEWSSEHSHFISSPLGIEIQETCKMDKTELLFMFITPRTGYAQLYPTLLQPHGL